MADPTPSVSVTGVLIQYSEMDVSSITASQEKAQEKTYNPISEDQSTNLKIEDSNPSDASTSSTHKTKSENIEAIVQTVSSEATQAELTLSQQLYNCLAFDETAEKPKKLQKLLAEGADNNFKDSVSKREIRQKMK